jgi:hypothetical protein
VTAVGDAMEAGSAGLLTVLAGLLFTLVGGAMVTGATDVAVAAARARTAADAAALAAIAASPLVGGDNDPAAAAAEVATANGARVASLSTGGGTPVRDGGWPRRVEVSVIVEPVSVLVRGIVPRLESRAAAEARPPSVPLSAPAPAERERAVPDMTGPVAAGPAGGSRLARELLMNPRIRLTAAARADIAAGRVDGRVLAALAALAQRHTIGVSVLRSGHSRFVAGTRRESRHYHGRAVDIATVDGRAVGPNNAAARAAVAELATLPQPPDEVGSPFPQFSGRLPGHFTDGDHRDHLHLGWGG